MASEVLALPDIESAACQYLRGELDARGLSARVATSVPADRPSRLVVLGLTAGGIRNLIQLDAVLLAECWAESEADAFRLASVSHALFRAMAGQTVGGVQVYRVEDGGLPVRLPDPETRNPRYQFTAQFIVRAQRI